MKSLPTTSSHTLYIAPLSLTKLHLLKLGPVIFINEKNKINDG